jgi:hypothetical protein
MAGTRSHAKRLEEVNLVEEYTRSAKIRFTMVWFSLMVSCLIYLGITEFLPLPAEVQLENERDIIYILLGACVALFFIGSYLVWNMTNPRSGETASGYLESTMAKFIIGLAMFEAIAIIGLVMWFLGISGTHFYLIGAGFILIFVSGSRISPIMQNYLSLKELDDARR